MNVGSRGRYSWLSTAVPFSVAVPFITAVLFSVLSVMSTDAIAGAQPDPTMQTLFIQLSLADSEVSRRWYSLVPSDSPVLLPLRQDSSNGVWNDVSGVQGRSAPLTVDGDPNGAVTDFGVKSAAGFVLVWTPTSIREPGQTYTARLAEGDARGGSAQQFTSYGASTFEFSYLDATSASFLPTATLAVADVAPTYTFVGARCCEVVAGGCVGAASCHQCWELEGQLEVSGAWDGPGTPYLTRSVRPALDSLAPGRSSTTFQIVERGEYCIEGTATAAGETTTLTACGMPTEPPVHEASGLQPVFAETCRIPPTGASPMTALVAVRAASDAAARELLAQLNAPPQPRAAPRPSLLPTCTVNNRRGRSSVPLVLSIVALLGASVWRRQRTRRLAFLG